MFNGKIYDQIKSGKFDFDHGKIREFHCNFRMGTLGQVEYLLNETSTQYYDTPIISLK